MASRFVHLHAHSHYSFLKALPKVDELVNAAKEADMPALALTDEGNLHGAIEFYKAATKAGVKPIIGVDAYLAPRTIADQHQGEKRSRIVLLAENIDGYKNLLKLVTISYTEGLFERPRMDRELLKKYAQGLIALIPSFAGDVPLMLAAGDADGAAALLEEYKGIFGEKNLFLEITRHPKVPGHEDKMQKLRSLSEQTGVPLVAQHDVYFLKPEDREACAVLRRIQQGSKGFNEEEDFSFVNEAQMLEWFSDIPDAVYRSGEIAERCHIEFTLGKWIFPQVDTDAGKDHDQMLRERAIAGITARRMEDTPELRERLDYELQVIKDKGFAKYFLIVSDLLTFAKNNGILTTTRGSAGGSLTSYLVGVTSVDPIFYKLPFERFLNPERPKAPDIDMDFADNRRDEVIAYAKRKYGEDRVAQIGTFGAMLARAAVRDTARALGHSYGVGDRIAKLIPVGSQGFPMTIDRAMEMEEDLKTLYREDDDVREIIDLAKRIEGGVRQTGVHAAGVVIAPSPLTDWAPLQFDPKGSGDLITQYDMYSITDEYGGVGLLKFDFLGIKNLAILADAVDRVRETKNIVIDIDTIPLDDDKTFAMLARGETEGLFQLNGSGMTRYLKELRPTTIHDINAMVALYRPGPMETIPQYIERKRNAKLIRFVDERMKEYLEHSYGLIVYQDDVLLTAIKLGGYTWLEADALRKAMGKKIPEEMEAQKENLMKGFKEYGKIPEKTAEAIWKLIEPFAAYGFNKCLAGDSLIYNPHTGSRATIASLLNERAEVPVVALTRTQALTNAKASWVRENGVKPLFKLTTRSGRVLRATDNHPLLGFDGWRQLGKLSPGDRIAVPRTLPAPARVVAAAPHEAAALGYLLSEGNLCHPHGLYFYSTKDSEIADFARAALAFPNARVSLNRSKSAVSAYVGKQDRKQKNGMFVWATQLGLLGKRATEKAVPAAAFGWDNASLALMLGKLWQGDGCVSLRNCQTYYATSSEALARDVQHLLLRFSILSTLHRKSFKYRGALKDGFTVVITGRDNLQRFEDTVGRHLIGFKQTSLELLVHAAGLRSNGKGRGTSDTVPAQVLELVRSEAAARHMPLAQLARQAGIASRLLSYDERKRGYTRPVLATIAQTLASPALELHAHSDVFWDEIRSIEPDGEEMTYDLTVPELENFVANDIIVHNSHAASYGKVAYQTAYMKANYPVEYMAAVLTADAGDTESISVYVAECERMKIPVLPPDVNESGTTFTVVGENHEAIRFGLSSIKNFGEGIAETIINEREKNGTFTSLSDFLCRVGSRGLNRKSLEALIQCGAMDSLGARGVMLKHIETLLTFHRDATAPAAQDSLFGNLAAPTLTLPAEEDTTTLKEKLAWERELLGIYVSGHPLDAHGDKTMKAHVTIGSIVADPRAGLPVILPVLIDEVRTVLTKKGERMAFLKLEDKSGSIEAVAFPKLYKEHASLMTVGNTMLVKATVSTRNGETSLTLENAKAL